MKMTTGILGTFITLLILTQFSYAQLKLNVPATIVKPGLSAEYVNLTIAWDEDTYTSKLKTYLFNTHTEFEIIDGVSFHVILGYSLSNFDGLIFRQLPFSVELGVGEIGGLLAGGEIDVRLLYLSEYEIIIHGQYVYYYGFNNEWKVPSLNVEGTVLGSPSWMRGQIGPLIRYEGLNHISPYLCIKYNRLWGKFKMEQEIQDLSGTEEKKIIGQSDFTLSLGADYEISPDFSVRGEATLMPFTGGLDFGGMVLLRYAFQTRERRNP